jgi:hypothetical protein
MSINISHLLERIDDTVVREAIKAIVDQSVTGDDVRNYLANTTFGFRETTDDSGNRVVQLEPRDEALPKEGFDIIPGG